ncbi:MAG: hypothetical protein ACI85N_001166 [Gammaproteobacteria bacterium]
MERRINRMRTVEFIEIALLKEVVFMALKMSLIVGSILAIINHGDAIFEGILTRANVSQIILTYLVPYSVSTYSSVKAIQRHDRKMPNAE